MWISCESSVSQEQHMSPGLSINNQHSGVTCDQLPRSNLLDATRCLVVVVFNQTLMLFFIMQVTIVRGTDMVVLGPGSLQTTNSTLPA